VETVKTRTAETRRSVERYYVVRVRTFFAWFLREANGRPNIDSVPPSFHDAVAMKVNLPAIGHSNEAVTLIAKHTCHCPVMRDMMRFCTVAA